MRPLFVLTAIVCSAAWGGDLLAQVIPPQSAPGALGAVTPRELPEGLALGSDLLGMNVENSAGEEIGEVKDFVVDRKTGAIYYLALSTGGFLGIGDTLSAIPWHLFQIRTEADDADDYFLVLNVDKNQLNKAPRIDNDNWPTFAAVESAWGVERQATRPSVPAGNVERSGENVGGRTEGRIERSIPGDATQKQ